MGWPCLLRSYRAVYQMRKSTNLIKSNVPTHRQHSLHRACTFKHSWLLQINLWDKALFNKMQVETFKDQLAAKLNKESPLHKNTLILLQTIDANITYRDDDSYKKSFIVAVLSLLQAKVQANDHEHLDSVLMLLNWLVPTIKRAFLVALSDSIVQICMHVVNQHEGKPSLLKFCIAVIGQLLQTVPPTKLKENIYGDSFACLLQQSLNATKVVRKQAGKTIKALLENRQIELFSPELPSYKNSLAQFLRTNILELNESVQHSVGLLAQVYKLIPFTVLGDAFQLIAKAIEVADNERLPHIFLAVETILLDRQMSPESVEKIIVQMLQLHIEAEDVNLSHSYLQCLRQCIISLVGSSQYTGGLFMPSVTSLMIEYLLQENPKLQKLATVEISKVIEAAGSSVLEKCQNTGVNEDLMMLELDSDQNKTIIQKYLITLEYLIGGRFDSVHNNVLEIVGSFFSTVKTSTFHLVSDFVVKFVAYFQAHPDRHQHHHFDKCVSKLVNSVSLQQILDVFPIWIGACDPLDPNYEIRSNCWLLNVFSKYGVALNLDHYLTTMFPILKQSLALLNKLQGGQERVVLSTVMQLFICLQKCRVKADQIEYPGIFRQNAVELVTLIASLIDDKLPFYSSLIRAAERSLTQLAFSEVSKGIVNEKAQSMISNLAKLVVSGNEKCRSTLNLIRVLAYQTTQEYLQRAISRNMEQILKINTDLKTDQTPQGLKNMEILIQVIPAFKFRNDTWAKCTEFVGALIKQKSPFQKKAYKFLLEIMEKVHYTYLEEVGELMVDSTTFTQSSSRAKRFQVLQVLLEKQFGTEGTQESRFTIFEFQRFIQNFLPEIVAGIRDKNLKTRQMIVKLLANVGKKLIEIEHLEAFISMVMAGLGTEGSLMKADAIVTVAVLVDTFYASLTPGFVSEVTSIVLMMLREHNNEIYKSVLTYLQHLCKAHKRNKISDQVTLKQIIEGLFEADLVAREKNIIALKRLMMRFIRAYGLQKVETAFPAKHLKLLRNIKRVDKRTRKNKSKKARNTYNQDVEEMAKALQKPKRTQRRKKSEDDDDEPEEAKQPRKQDGMEEEKPKEDQNMLLKYDVNKERFHFVTDVAHQKRKAAVVAQEPELKDVEFKNGKLIVKELKEVSGLKRRRENRFEEEEPKPHEKKVRPQKAGETVHVIRESGDVFKSKSGRAVGDIQIKGRPEPFAFIQLNPKVLNKRFRAKAQKAFDQVLSKKQQR